jgi:hypothetical protein
MHAIYTTPGFIIGSRPSGEAGKLISIFTRDLGLVFASAQGIRFEKSKLRPFTQDYSFGEFSFVRGKEYWRLTSAQEERDSSSGKPSERAKAIQQNRAWPNENEPHGQQTVTASFERAIPLRLCGLIARVASLLERLLHGEEAHPELFDCVRKAADFIGKKSLSTDDPNLAGLTMLDAEELQTLESLIVIRILNKLGYVGDVAELNGHIHSDELTVELLDNLKAKRITMNSHINKALRESHL